jgi:hypothetical protein
MFFNNSISLKFIINNGEWNEGESLEIDKQIEREKNNLYILLTIIIKSLHAFSQSYVL